MLFSVVIPTFNRRSLLREALDSVWAQAYQDYEVIVIDDGSLDGTRQDLANPGDRLTVVFQENHGPGAARNAGAVRARGDYIAFLDSDDLWFPWTLQTFQRVIQDTHGPAVIVGAYTEFSEGEAVPMPAAGALRYECFDDYLGSADRAIATGAGTAVIRRSVFLSSGGFTPRRVNCEDHDLALRLGEQRGFVAISTPPTLAWRRHTGTLTATPALSVAGARYLLSQERGGLYPGGRERAAERRAIVSRHVRPVSLAALRDANLTAAFGLYAQTFGWHLRDRRFAYLAWFPFAALVVAAKRLIAWAPA